MHLSLKLLNGEELEFDIKGQTCIIGRSQKCDVVIPHDGMSRHHCQIDNESGELFITDLGSTNGVMIDGQKIGPNVKTPYATFLSLSFGAVQSAQVSFEETKPALSQKVKVEAAIQQNSVVAAAPRINKKEKANTILVNTMAFFILAGAVWWYMQKEEETLPQESNTVSDSKPVYDVF